MKFSKLALAFASLISVAFAAEEAVPEFVPTEQKPFDFRIEYLVKDRQTVSTEVISLTNGESASLEYEFTNGEEEECTIVGVGGQLISPSTGEVLYNVTATNVGPLAVGSTETSTFIQNIGIDLIPDTYLIVPAIYIVFNDKLMVLGSRNQLIIVDDPQISIFNPKLLVLEVILAGSLAYFAYFLYKSFGAQFLDKYLAPAKKESKKSASPTAAQVKSTGSSTYDESWLPATHLKSTSKKTKKTK